MANDLVDASFSKNSALYLAHGAMSFAAYCTFCARAQEGRHSHDETIIHWALGISHSVALGIFTTCVVFELLPLVWLSCLS